jgi:hypothetical protein
MNEELKKSLTDLIDETLLELEELKKSRFSASEIDIKGPGEGIAGKPSNGKLDGKMEMAMSEKDKDKDKDKDEGCDDAEKAEGHNRQSDPDGGKHKPVAGEGMKNTNGRHSESPGASVTHGQGKNSESDPGNTQHQSESVSKEEDKDEDDDKKKKDKDAKGGEDHEKKEKKAIKDLSDLAGMKKGDSPSPEEVDKQMRAVAEKSQKETESLMKSYVDEKVKPLEDKLSTILDLVNKIADQPVPAKGATGRTVPLLKSAEDGGEQLSKSEVASKLFDLKKSGTKVDSLDITRAEMGQDLNKIMEKYKIS